jgi:hypothetical protein
MAHGERELCAVSLSFRPGSDGNALRFGSLQHQARPDAGQVMETDARRSSIETTIQGLLAHLSLDRTRGGRARSALNAVSCRFGLFALVALLSSVLPACTAASEAVSDRGQTEVVFSDDALAVRRPSLGGGVF